MNGITTASTHRWVSEKLERRCTTQTRAASSAASPRQLRTENIDYAHISRPAKSTWWAGNHAPKEPAARTEITIQQAPLPYRQLTAKCHRSLYLRAFSSTR